MKKKVDELQMKNQVEDQMTNRVENEMTNRVENEMNNQNKNQTENQDKMKDITIIHVDDQKNYQMLGQGNTAEIFQYEDNRILKLFRESMPITPIQNEYRISRIVQNHLDNTPKAYEFVEYRKRYGIVYEQIKGVDMIQLLVKNIFKTKYYSKLFAQIHASMHKDDIDVHYSVKEKLTQDINSCNDLTDEEKDRIKRYLQTLPDKSNICHFDFHPGNIMIQENEPIVIDWMTACTGDANADVARTLLLMRMAEMMHVSKLQRTFLHIGMQSVGKQYFKEYRKQTGVTTEEVNEWMLPVAAGRLAEWLTDHERKKLVMLVRKKLASLD